MRIVDLGYPVLVLMAVEKKVKVFFNVFVNRRIFSGTKPIDRMVNKTDFDIGIPNLWIQRMNLPLSTKPKTSLLAFAAARPCRVETNKPKRDFTELTDSAVGEMFFMCKQVIIVIVFQKLGII